MKRILVIGLFILGVIQFSAIVNGFIDMLGGFFGIIAAFVLSEIPVLGTIMGIRGAVNNWNWDVLPAILLFVGVPAIAILFSLISSKKSE